MSEILDALDAPSLEDGRVDQGALVGIGGTMLFDQPLGGPPTVEDLRAILSARVGALRRYSQRLSSLRDGHFFWPRWEPDPQLEIGHHIRRAVLPGPGRDHELCNWMAGFFSDPLDRARPPWELVLVEGIEGGRWALAHKRGHCQVDGVGSVDMLGLLLDHRPGSRTPQPDTSPFATRSFDAHRLSLTSPLGDARRYAVVRAPLAELEDVGHVLGGSSRDVILAACAGGLRRLVPNGRAERLGPAVRSLFVELPIDEPLAAVRVARIAAQTRRARSTRPVSVPFSRPQPSVTITDASGSPAPLYAFGARLRDVLPVVPLEAQQDLGITIFTYDGMVYVGLLSDPRSIPDLHPLASGIEASLDELRAYSS